MRILWCGILLFIISGCSSPNGTNTDDNNTRTQWEQTNAGLEFLVINDLAQNLEAPATLYAGTMQNLYKSRDRGKTWQVSSAGLQSHYINCIEYHPSDTSRVYCGTKNGIHYSDDSGQNWIAISADKRIGQVNAIGISSQDRIWVGTLSGLYKSDNGGATWQLAEPGQYERISAIAVDPENREIIYAGVRYQGIFKSTNNGKSWAQMNEGIFHDWWGYDYPVQIIFQPTHSSTIYIITSGNWLHRSTDSGQSWHHYEGDLKKNVFISMAISHADPDLFYVATVDKGVHVSRDGGRTFTEINQGLESRELTTILVNPGEPDMVILGTNGHGVYRYPVSQAR